MSRPRRSGGRAACSREGRGPSDSAAAASRPRAAGSAGAGCGGSRRSSVTTVPGSARADPSSRERAAGPRTSPRPPRAPGSRPRTSRPSRPRWRGSGRSPRPRSGRPGAGGAAARPAGGPTAAGTSSPTGRSRPARAPGRGDRPSRRPAPARAPGRRPRPGGARPRCRPATSARRSGCRSPPGRCARTSPASRRAGRSRLSSGEIGRLARVPFTRAYRTSPMLKTVIRDSRGRRPTSVAGCYHAEVRGVRGESAGGGQLQGPGLLPIVHGTADERDGRGPDRAGAAAVERATAVGLTFYAARAAPLEPHALAYDKPLCASLAGFTLHAATRAGATRLCRTALAGTSCQSS